MFPKPRPKRAEKRSEDAKRQRLWLAVREKAFARDGYLCRVCGTNRPFDGHHLLARSLGGRDELMNVLSVCRRCHEDITGHVVKIRWRNEADRAGSIQIETVA